MLTIAFCSHQESMLNQIPLEIAKSFSRRGIDIKALPVKNPNHLLEYAQHSIYPDIVIFSQSIISTNFINTFLFLKEQKYSIIFILSKDSESFNHSLEDDYTFLLHPFYNVSSASYQELWNCVCKAFDFINSDQNTFAYYHRPSYHSIPLNHILYFSSEGRCVRLVTRNGSDSFYGKLNELENSLKIKNCRFIRIHQSYLINEQFIHSYDRRNVILITGEVLPVSKGTYYQQLKKMSVHK